VGDEHGERAGVAGAAAADVGAVVAVRADQLQLNADGAIALHHRGHPHMVAEADESPVRAVAVVVDWQCVGAAVQGECALGDPVAIPANGLAEVRPARIRRRRAVLADVFGQGLEAEHHVGLVAVPAGDSHGLDDAAVVEDLDLHTRAVGEGVLEHLGWLARIWLDGRAEGRGGDGRVAGAAGRGGR
jgi:hypothetical protein